MINKWLLYLFLNKYKFISYHILILVCFSNFMCFFIFIYFLLFSSFIYLIFKIIIITIYNNIITFINIIIT